MGTTTRDGVKTARYVRGWRDPEQDRRPPPKISRITSQDYETIKRECLAKGVLWEDPSFPASDRSAFPNSPEKNPREWKRPGELESNPRMFVEGFTRFDVNQGELGNCWFLAAIASLCSAGNNDLIRRIVPEDNLFGKDYGYAGVFHFKFWQYGKWVDIVIDDRLPIKNGRLYFVHSSTKNEFWPALLEKAYAKLYGSYEALVSGRTAEAMEDFTGGVSMSCDLREEVPKGLFLIMKMALDREGLMGCSVVPGAIKPDRDHRLPSGLIVSHAYSVTAAKTVTVRGLQFELVRVRNPWGGDNEWNGAWSDRSQEWKLLSQADKDGIGLIFENDGEFWMSFDDFTRNFSTLEICIAMSLDVPTGKMKWEQTTHEGSWKCYVNAGGCTNSMETFWTNPQYKIQVVNPDGDDSDGTGILIVSLIQKDRRKKLKELGIEMLYIGYAIYKIPDEQAGPLDMNFFRFNRAVPGSPKFEKIRDTVGIHEVPPGTYVVVPCTFKPNCEGDFLLRIFSAKPAPSSEIDEGTRFIDNTDVKVKDDVTLYNTETDPQPKGIKETVLAEPESRRRKSLLVTDDDRKEESDLKERFRQIAGSDLEVDAYELRDLLDSRFKPEFKFEGVGLETARSIVAMMDIDHSGKLGYEEFKKLWADLRQWKKVFLEYDVSRRNSLSASDLRPALNSSGFLISNHTFKCLVMRYSDPKGFVQFNDFILCAVRLKAMHELFKELTRGRSQPIPFTLDEFIQSTMYS